MFNSKNYSKILNVPGSSGGETNGLYASITQSDFFPPDDSYLSENTPGIFDFIGGAVDNLTRINNQIRQEKANAKVNVAPSASAEWASLTLFEKVGFALAIFGVVYLVVKR